MKSFSSPSKSLGNLDAETAATLIAAASDIALVIDESGVISDVAFHSEALAADLPDHGRWVGRPWTEIVTVESRPKVISMLRGSGTKTAQPWRHLNHPAANGRDVAILYSVVKVGTEGRAVAFGRDLRPISDLQRRLVDAQQSLERDYSRLRHVELRYRLLFQMSTEAVLILDAATLKIIEANPAAYQLLDETGKRLLGRVLSTAFDAESRAAVQSLLTTLRSTGRATEVKARLAPAGTRAATRPGHELLVSASLFREEGAAMFLVRLTPEQGEPVTTALPESRAKLLSLVESAPDGCVVVDTDGAIIAANGAFRDLAQVATSDQVRGEPLDRWLGRPGVDVDVLIDNLRQHGSVRLFSSIMRGENGGQADVEISAVALRNGGQSCYGLAIRNVGRRLGVENPLTRELPRSAEHLTELIGRVALKDLVREATDVIERLCIETALKMTDDNRASAAGMLGLSRQSFYAKLRRYGLGNLAAESGD